VKGHFGISIVIELSLLGHCMEGVFQGANGLWMLAFKASKSKCSGGGVILLRVGVVGGGLADACVG